MVQGYCHEKFAIVREIFEKNINTGFERGAAVAIELEGEKVVEEHLGQVPTPVVKYTRIDSNDINYQTSEHTMTR